MPPPFLTLGNAGLSFGDKRLFDDLNLALSPGDRACLVGANGSGKTTLMRCLLGEIELDAGERFRQPGAAIHYLPQDTVFAPGDTVAAFIARAWPAQDGEPATDAPRYLAEQAAGEVDLDPDNLCETLSGGESRRAGLARAFLGRPDVLLLDEPTNHLDIATIQWLEERLLAYRGALLVISHDRAFLNRVSGATLWLQRRRIARMNAPFSQFESWSAQLIEADVSRETKLKRKLDRETQWLARGVTARRRRNQGRLRKLQELRAQRAARDIGQKPVKLNKGDTPTAGQLVIDTHQITKAFGQGSSRKVIVEQYSTRILRGDRVGVFGPNGAGKTTLARMLCGMLKPDAGRVRLGFGVHAAMFAQTRDALDPKMTPWRYICDSGGDQVVRGKHSTHVVGYLKTFGFSRDDAGSLIGTFSGGQKNRLRLAKILAQPSNLLILDEPTNDLDMDSLDALIDTLSDYEGSLIIVSHDRDFLDRLATSVIVMAGDGKAEEYVGGYSDAMRQRQPGRAGAKSPAAGKKRTATGPGKPGAAKPPGEKRPVMKKLGYKEQRELDNLPAQAEALRAEISALEKQMADPALFSENRDAFAAAAARLTEAKETLAAGEERWLELELLREELAKAVSESR